MDSEKTLNVLVERFLKKQKKLETKAKSLEQGQAAEIVKGLSERREKPSTGIMGAIKGTLKAYDNYKKSRELKEEFEKNPPPMESTMNSIRGIDYTTADLVDTSSAAIRLIQVMIAAAHADGTLDDDERKLITKQMKRSGIREEEEYFILGEMEHPRSLDELVEGVTEPQLKQTMYLVAALAIQTDTLEEAEFMSDFSFALGLSSQELAVLNERLQTGE